VENERDLLAQYGRLELEKETHISRLQDTERQMADVRQRLINLKAEGKVKTGKAT